MGGKIAGGRERGEKLNSQSQIDIKCQARVTVAGYG